MNMNYCEVRKLERIHLENVWASFRSVSSYFFVKDILLYTRSMYFHKIMYTALENFVMQSQHKTGT